MFLVTVVLSLLLSMSSALGGESSSDDSVLFKRSTFNDILSPTELFICSLNKTKTYYRKTRCERTFQVQNDLHDCATRRLLVMRIDHQLARMEQDVMQIFARATKETVESCQRENEFGCAAKLKEEISSLRLRLAEAQDIKRNTSQTVEQLGLMEEFAKSMADQKKNEVARLEQAIQNISQSKSSGIKNSTISLASDEGEFASITSATDATGPDSTCSDRLAQLVSAQLNCSMATVPDLLTQIREADEARRAAAELRRDTQRNLTACEAEVLECRESDVCENVREIVQQGEASRHEQKRLSDLLAPCNASLSAARAAAPRCEASLASTRNHHDALLVNVTRSRLQQQELDQDVLHCETELSHCQENITACDALSTDLEEREAGCWSDLDKWKFRTDICSGRLAMLWQSTNATTDFIGDMQGKLAADVEQLINCQDRLIYHRSGHAEATHTLEQLEPKLEERRAAADACFQRCPQLRPPAKATSCPSSQHGATWHELETGCYLVTGPGASFGRMAEYCEEEAPGASLVRLDSQAMAEDAYEALLDRFLSISSGAEALRRHRRAWVDFADGFQYAGSPTQSFQCATDPCSCWTMRFPWKGKSQLFTCSDTNLPAICHVPLAVPRG